jgi:hypothetical protein
MMRLVSWAGINYAVTYYKLANLPSFSRKTSPSTTMRSLNHASWVPRYSVVSSEPQGR